jgi:selenophosphate synthase
MFRLLGTLDVAPPLGFFQFFAQIGEASSICGFGLLVEHLTRIAQTADVDSRLFEILSPMRQAVRGLTDFVVIAPTRDSTCQIKHMEFDPGMTQQMGEVSEPFRAL